MISDFLKAFIALTGFSMLLVVCAAILLTMYPGFRTLVGDILHALGWVGKWFRRASIQSEIEGSLNLFAHKYSGELANSFLPDCEVNWVNEKNVDAMWKDGLVIVKVSFNEDHDKTFLAATIAFVKTGLLPRAKHFLSRTTADAVDLLVARTILRDSRRTALRLFNDTFNLLAESCRERFQALEDLDTERLFRPILLQQYFLLGEDIGDGSPREEYATEADAFLLWLHKLAMRAPDEQSELAFPGVRIRVGVILVASEDTYRNFGLDPYLRRADKYALDQFDTIYLMSRGRRRAAVTKEIGATLVATGNFTQLTKLPDFVIRTGDSLDLITILPLRADLVGIVLSAWARFAESQREGRTVTVIIDHVEPDAITVSAYGMKADIPLADLSLLQITDARRYFRRSQELEVFVIELDQQRNLLRLSNCDTPTDPKKIVDEISATLQGGAYAKVTGYRNMDGIETALLIEFEGTSAIGYVPRTRASFSRFVPLSETYPMDARLLVSPLEFQPRFNSFLSEVSGRIDPWESVAKYAVGGNYDATLRQISERSLVYEVEAGIEAVVYVEEVAWDAVAENLATIRSKVVGEKALVQVLAVNSDYRQLRSSLKRVHEGPKQAFCRLNKGATLPVKILTVNPEGAYVEALGQNADGMIPRYEVSWIYCPDITVRLSPGQQIDARLVHYDARSDAAIFSVREVFSNDFEGCTAEVALGGTVVGTVLSHIGPNTEVVVEWQPGKTAAAYVHKSQITNVAYVNDSDLPTYLPLGTTWHFITIRYDPRFRLVELSRKELLRQVLPDIEYGEDYSVVVTRVGTRDCCVYGDRIESGLVQLRRKQSVGDGISVFVARKSNSPRELEVEQSS